MGFSVGAKHTSSMRRGWGRTFAPGHFALAARHVARDGPRGRCGAQNQDRLAARGLDKEPLGVDIAEVPVLFALQKEGLEIVDGQQLSPTRA